MQSKNDNLPFLSNFTGKALITYKKGRQVRGFALKKGEFVTSLKALSEAQKKVKFP
ncbi:hypothetical protein [Kosakonia sacchari]|uniref:hypothetical protein n=1 Tax=Kosakonia sacchari TaxID=1158459 RepID=UPI0015859C23|nr:hypothetical protein [Kosakonia sacchari]NUL36612.1 hypothetical protein [Kosakonia sacchari]